MTPKDGSAGSVKEKKNKSVSNRLFMKKNGDSINMINLPDKDGVKKI